LRETGTGCSGVLNHVRCRIKITPNASWTERKACCLGWQESLLNLARLVEPDIND
jgi:hypothetical protein